MNTKMFEFIFKTLDYQMAGRLHSPKDRLGKVFTNPDGEEFIIFKQTILDPATGIAKEPEAIFRVQFRVPKIMPWRDRFVISLKSPIFVALPGFRSKLWMVDEKNATYQGIYEWSTLRDAQDYVYSASMEFMTSVAVPGGISYEIIPAARVAQKDSTLWIEREKISMNPDDEQRDRPARVNEIGNQGNKLNPVQE
jgi:hypothetical protein